MLHWSFNPGRFDGWERGFDHWGTPNIVGFVLMIVLWAVVIAALVLAIRALILHSRRSHNIPPAPGSGVAAAGPVPKVQSAPSAQAGSEAAGVATAAAGGVAAGEDAAGEATAQGTTAGEAVSAPSPATLLAILGERYARGEIDREEFLQRKADLGLS